MTALAAHCPLLESLTLGYVKVTDVSICAVAQQCRSLRRLSVEGCSGVTDASMLALSENCPNLEDLNCNCRATDVGLCAVLRKCHKLAVLDIISWVTDATLLELSRSECAARCLSTLRLDGGTLAGSFPHLRVLETRSADHCVDFSGAHLPSLQTLGPGNVSDASLRHAGACGLPVRDVHLSNCYPFDVTDSGVRALFEITDSGVRALAEGCASTLWSVHLPVFPQLSYRAVEALLITCTRLRSVSAPRRLMASVPASLVNLAAERGVRLESRG